VLVSETTVLFGRARQGAEGDDRFELEALALEELDIEAYALPLEPIVLGDAELALRKLPRPCGRTGLYRGWMLREEEYASLHEALLDRDELLVVDPESFAEVAYAPNYLPLLGERTAPARWTESDDIEEAWELAEELGPAPWIVKDWVKSAKEEWFRACFVPKDCDFEDFSAICERLLEVRGDAFETGFVVKKYLELATLPGWTAERRRVTDEHRLIFWQGELVAHAPYHDVDAMLEDPGRFSFIGRAVSSPFFTADVARLVDGGWTIVELNDGGSSIFPERLDPRDFYQCSA
jgi:hypothetical protein